MTKPIVIPNPFPWEYKKKRTIMETRRCPYCGGQLRHTPPVWASWQYDCLKCGRAWRIDGDENWHAGFDAGMHIYNKYGELISSYDGRIEKGSKEND